MRHKVADLEGKNLDAAVAKAEDVILVWENFERLDYSAINELDGRYYKPSTDWRIGGRIIERERISIQFVQPSAEWEAAADYVALNHGLGWTGQSPLIAAMRGYVASKFGEEIEL